MFQKKEESWQTCQADLNNMKIKCVLQGELGINPGRIIREGSTKVIFSVVRQNESLEKLSSRAQEEELKMFQMASSREIEGLKSAILSKSHELTSAKTKAQELENKVTELTELVNSHQKMIDNIHENHKERLDAVESRHRAVRSINSHLETTIMELQAMRLAPGQSSDSMDMMQISSMR